MIDIKSKLNQNKVSIGSWLTLPSETIAEIMSNSYFDWIVVDLEHSSININQAENLIRVIDLNKKIPLVRITNNDPNLIKRVMDAGAHGIIVPNIISKDDAELAIKSTKYQPKGIRGVGLARAQGYGRNFKEYFKWQKNKPIIIIQIEDKTALPNLDKIFSLSEIDGCIIGPYDLSASLGCPGDFKNKIFLNSIKTIKKFAKKYKCSLGIHVVEPNEKHLRQALKEQYKLIAFTVDFRIIDSFIQGTTKILKKFH